MNKRTTFAVTMLALGVAACSQSTPFRSGGSGALENRTFGTASIASNATGCPPRDSNCQIIYNGPGGGD